MCVHSPALCGMLSAHSCDLQQLSSSRHVAQPHLQPQAGSPDCLIPSPAYPSPLVSTLVSCFFIFIFDSLSMWTIFKIFIEFVTVLLLFYVLVFRPRGMRDASSLTRN